MLILDNRHHLRSNTALAGLVLLAFLVAVFLCAEHFNSETFSNHEVFPLFVVFLSWFISLVGYGHLILRRFRFYTVELSSSLLLGSVFYSILIGTLGSCHLLRSKWLILSIIFLGIPYGVTIVTTTAREFSAFLRSAKDSMAIYILIASYFCLRFIQSLTPDMHPDALWYHLTAPEFWYQQNGFFFNPNAIQLTQASFWDLLHLWPVTIFGDLTRSALIAIHLFSQWITLFIGVAGTIAILIKLFRKIIPIQINDSWIALLSLALMTTSELSTSMPTPKNDWGVALWFSGGALFALHKSRKTGAFMIGLATAAKFSYAVPTLVFSVLFLLATPNLNAAITYGLCILLPISIVCLRNFVWTGNPLFPVFNSVFPSSYLPQVWETALTSYTEINRFNLKYFVNGWFSLFPLTQLTTYLVLIPKSWKRISDNNISKSLFIFLVGSYILFTLISGARTELRLVGITSLLVSGLSVYALFLLKTQPIIRILPEKILKLCFVIYLIGFSETPWRNIYGGINSYDPNRPVRESSIGFISENIEPRANERILLTYETALYYLLPSGAVRIWDSSVISNDLTKYSSPIELVAKLENYGFRYLLLTSVVIDNFYNQSSLDGILSLVNEHPESIVARRGADSIIDLKMLTSAKKS